MERMPVWQVAIKRLDMPIQRFLFIFVGGAALTGLISGILVVFLTGGLGTEHCSKVSLAYLCYCYFQLFLLSVRWLIHCLKSNVQQLKSKRRCICSSLEWVFYRSEKSALSRFLIS